MAVHKLREDYLASRLLESIQDEFYGFVKIINANYFFMLGSMMGKWFYFIEMQKVYCWNMAQIQIC